MAKDFKKAYQEAKAANLSDEEIFGYLESSEEYGSKIQQAISGGASQEDIISFLSQSEAEPVEKKEPLTEAEKKRDRQVQGAAGILSGGAAIPRTTLEFLDLPRQGLQYAGETVLDRLFPMIGLQAPSETRKQIEEREGGFGPQRLIQALPTAESAEKWLEDVTGLDLEAKSAEGAMIKKGAQRGVSIGPLAATGGSKVAIEETARIFLGGAAGEGVRQAGGPEWLATTTELAIDFENLIRGGYQAAKQAWKKSKNDLIPQMAKTEDVWAKMEMESFGGPEKKVHQLSKRSIQEYGAKSEKLAQETDMARKTFDSAKREGELIGEVKEGIVQSVAPGAPSTNQGRMGALQRTVVDLAENQKAIYSGAYDVARDRGKAILMEAEDLQPITDAIKKLRSQLKLATKTTDDKSLTRILNTLTKDLKLGKSQSNKIIDIFTGEISATKLKKVTARDLMDLNRVLNNLSKYETLAPSSMKRIQSVADEIRTVLNTKLENFGEARNAWNLAQSEFKDWQARFGGKEISAFRFSETPEKMVEKFMSGSSYDALKNALKYAPPEAAATLEAQLVSYVRDNPKRAGRILREFKGKLSKRAESAIVDLNNMGTRLGKSGARAAAQEVVLKEITDMGVLGSRPEQTLKNMDTVDGRLVVKQTVGNSPEGKLIWKELNRQKTDDIMKTLTDKAGNLKWDEAAEVFAHPNTQHFFREAFGKDAAEFAKRLGGYSKKIAANLERYSARKPGDLKKGLGYLGKILLGGAGLAKGGITGGIAGAVLPPLASLVKKSFYSLMTNPKFRGLIKALASPGNWNKKELARISVALSQIESDEKQK